MPIQTLVHLYHTCEALSEIHTMTHHRCWRLIHGELSRLVSSDWSLICIHNEKNFRTVWTELAQEFPEVFNHCEEQTLWNTARDTEMQRPLTRTETARRQQGISHEQIAEDRLWNKRPDGIVFKILVERPSVESIRTKLAMTIFDEYAKILKGMYSIRFNGRSDLGGSSARPDSGR